MQTYLQEAGEYWHGRMRVRIIVDMVFDRHNLWEANTNKGASSVSVHHQ